MFNKYRGSQVRFEFQINIQCQKMFAVDLTFIFNWQLIFSLAVSPMLLVGVQIYWTFWGSNLLYTKATKHSYELWLYSLILFDQGNNQMNRHRCEDMYL